MRLVIARCSVDYAGRLTAHLPSAPRLILVKADGSLVLNDGSKETAITRVELAKTLKPLIDAKRTERVVFVDFEDQVVYGDAVSIMDTIKGAGAEKVALKLKEEKPPGSP